jgi:antitoxin MazE
MKTRIVRIGNSRGVRIPKPLLMQAGLGDEVELRVEAGAIRIESVSAPRTGWAEAAEQLVQAEGTGLLDPPTPTRFDRAEWEW